MTLSRYEVAVVLCVDYRYETEFGRIKNLLLSKGVGRVVPFVDGKGSHLPLHLYDQISPLPRNDWEKKFSIFAYSQFRAMLKIFNNMKHAPYDNFLFVEDDLELRDNFDEVATAAHQQLPDEWDLIYYGANHEPAKTYDVGPNLMQINGSTCLQCIGINRPVYNTLLGLKPVKPIDVAIAETIHPRSKSFAVWPNVAIQKPGYSHLQRQRVDYTHHWDCKGVNR